MCLPPSVIAHIVNGFLVLTAILYSLVNLEKLRALDPYRITVLLLLFAIVIGVHSLSHLGLEKGYGYVWAGWRSKDSRETFVNGVTCPCRELGICPGWRSGFGPGRGQCPCLGRNDRCPYCIANVGR